MIKLQARNITKSYGSRLVIKDISIELHENECVSLVGVSGIGKTTLLNILSGIIMPDSGNVYLDNEDITGTAGKVGYMLQKDLLLPYKTIIDNVFLPLVISRRKKVGVAAPLAKGGMSRSDKGDFTRLVQKYFPDFGLEGTENKYPSQLSRRNEAKSCTSQNIHVFY